MALTLTHEPLHRPPTSTADDRLPFEGAGAALAPLDIDTDVANTTIAAPVSARNFDLMSPLRFGDVQ
ncbi:hypothetical protein AOZ06_04830 [Kibdelosporangium phytohabitans]|uniref:Uncharacterized protein n=1 Tax=Kibdelosporangium phytohabitans TaxID=860235 RepID=A0A0N9HJT7_9PSEU|nr:hypothetical protein AOZ06_04830 [Kibdelosporangium phytohabitans]